MPPISGAKKRFGESRFRGASRPSRSARRPSCRDGRRCRHRRSTISGRLALHPTGCPSSRRRDRRRLQRRALRQAAGGDDHDVGFPPARPRPRPRSCSGSSTPSRSSSASRQSTMPIISRAAGSARPAAPARRRWSAASQHRHLVAALGRDPRCLQPGRAGADHDDLAAGVRGSARSRAASSLRAPSRRCGCTAPRRLRRCGRGSRSRRRRGGSDARRPASDLPDDMRIGDVGARHAHHVELAGGDRMARGRHIVDARGVEDREPRRRPHLAGEIEMRRRRACPAIGMTSVSAASLSICPRMTFRKSTLPRRGQRRAISTPSSRDSPFSSILVGHHADADEEIRPHRRAHGIEHRASVKRKPVVERSRHTRRRAGWWRATRSCPSDGRRPRTRSRRGRPPASAAPPTA